MVKLLICLLFIFSVGLFALHLRHQQLELKHQNAVLQQRIQAQQARLWDHQLQIAVQTAPNALARSLASHPLDLVPTADVPAAMADWIAPPQPR